MRILLVTSEYGFEQGGLALHCAQLKEIYEQIGHTVIVANLSEEESFFAVDGGYDPKLGNKLRDSYRLKKLIDNYSGEADICVSCGAGHTSYIAMLFCRMQKMRLIVVACGSDINLSIGSAEQTFYNVESVRYADSFVAASNEIINATSMLCGVSRTRFFVIPNFYDMGIEGAEVDTRDREKKRIVFASGATHLNEKKGIGNLIKAFSGLINEYERDAVLYLYGLVDEDVKQVYERIIKENALENNVFLCGGFSREDFLEQMKSVDVYIQASPFEGFGNSVVEAIKLGKDILISNTGFTAELIREEFPGHIMNSLDDKKMSGAIADYCSNVYPKYEDGQIRDRLRTVLEKENVISMWRSVLDMQKGEIRKHESNSVHAVMFHDVGDSYSGIDHARAGFEDLVKKVYDAGYRLCTSREYFMSSQKENLIICTFDDGYENVYRNAFSILNKYGFTATVFVCPDLVGGDNSWNHKDEVNRNHMTAEMLREVSEAGWEIGSHGLSHMNLLRLSEHDLEHSLSESKRMLEPYGSIECFCYPYGAYNPFIKKCVEKYYDRAFSVSIGGTDPSVDAYQLIRYTPEELYKRLEM